MMDRMVDEFRLVRLTPEDATGWSDDFSIFRDLVISNEPAYPMIRKWLDSKVSSGIRSSERVAYLAYLNNIPVASAVLKRGRHAKFCHLRLAPDVREQNLGELFFCLMALEVRNIAEDVHFTLPEGLWEEKNAFFRSFAFLDATRAQRQYRLFEEELLCQSPYASLHEKVIHKLPKLSNYFSIRGHSMATSLVLSIQQPFLERILAGQKSVEIRRRFSSRWIGSRAVLCSSKTLFGEVTIRNVVEDTPERLWSAFGSEIGCTRSEFDRYVAGASELHAIVVDEVTPYLCPLPFAQLEQIVGARLNAPQSYATTANSQKWEQAVAVAALLHGSVRTHVIETSHSEPEVHSTSLQMSFI